MSHHPIFSGGGPDDDPDSGATYAIGIAGSLVLVAIVVFLQGLFGQASRFEQETKVIAERPVELESLRAAQLQQLGTYRWVDANEGIAAIPIERAMELLVRERKGAGTAGTP